MTKKQALAACLVAGYHGDQKTFTRAYIESKLSIARAHEAYNNGQKARENGLLCACQECRANAKTR